MSQYSKGSENMATKITKNGRFRHTPLSLSATRQRTLTNSLSAWSLYPNSVLLPIRGCSPRTRWLKLRMRRAQLLT